MGSQRVGHDWVPKHSTAQALRTGEGPHRHIPNSPSLLHPVLIFFQFSWTTLGQSPQTTRYSLKLNSYLDQMVAQTIKNLPAMQERQVWSLSQEDSPRAGDSNPFQYSCRKNSMGILLPSPGESSWLRDQTQVSCIPADSLPSQPPGKPCPSLQDLKSIIKFLLHRRKSPSFSTKSVG